MKNYIYLVFSILFILSCADSNKESNTITSELKKGNQVESSQGLDLLQKHCYICHSPESSSHDEITGPSAGSYKNEVSNVNTKTRRGVRRRQL